MLALYILPRELLLRYHYLHHGDHDCQCCQFLPSQVHQTSCSMRRFRSRDCCRGCCLCLYLCRWSRVVRCVVMPHCAWLYQVVPRSVFFVFCWVFLCFVVYCCVLLCLPVSCWLLLVVHTTHCEVLAWDGGCDAGCASVDNEPRCRELTGTVSPACRCRK